MDRSIALAVLLGLLAGCSSLSDDSHAVKSAKVHTELAGLYYQRAQYGVALDELSKAFDADSRYAPAYSVRGLVHMALHEDKDAESDFKRSLELDATDSDTHNNYGWFLCQRDRVSEAIPQFMDAVKNPLYATPGVAYLNAGLCSRKAGKNQDAEDFLKKALVVQPESTQALFALADLSFSNGDFYRAKKYFETLSQKSDTLSPEQLWLGVRINRKIGDPSTAASYATQLRNRYPDASETQMLIHGE